MQTQDAPAEFLIKLWPWLEAKRKVIIGAVVAMVVLGLGWSFFSWLQENKESAAGEAFTQLIISPEQGRTPEKLATQLEKIAADYPGTSAGQRAQLHAAATLFAAGKFPEAAAQFKKVEGTLADVAALGLAASLEAQKNTVEAEKEYKHAISLAGIDGSPTILAPAKLALGRIAEQQEKLPEALKYYQDAGKFPIGGSVVNEASERAKDVQARIAAKVKPAAK